MKYVKPILLVLFIAALYSACSKKEDVYIASQEKTIDEFWKVVDTNKFLKIAQQDIYRITEKGKEGNETQKVEPGSTVLFNYIGGTLTAKGQELANIFDTNISSKAKERGLEPSNNGEVYSVVIGKGSLISGLEIGIQQMRKGEESYIFFTSKHGYGKNEMSIIPKYSPLIFYIQIVDVKK